MSAPVDTYGLRSFFHFDGIDVNKRFDINDGTLNVKAFYGRSDQNILSTMTTLLTTG